MICPRCEGNKPPGWCFSVGEGNVVAYACPLCRGSASISTEEMIEGAEQELLRYLTCLEAAALSVSKCLQRVVLV